MSPSLTKTTLGTQRVFNFGPLPNVGDYMFDKELFNAICARVAFRPWQLAILTFAVLHNNEMGLPLTAPPGSGKTLVFLTLAACSKHRTKIFMPKMLMRGLKRNLAILGIADEQFAHVEINPSVDEAAIGDQTDRGQPFFTEIYDDLPCGKYGDASRRYVIVSSATDKMTGVFTEAHIKRCATFYGANQCINTCIENQTVKPKLIYYYC